MADSGPRLTAAERADLLRTAGSRSAPHGVATRARLVVDCAEVGVAEAARRSAVSPRTAAKWHRRYADHGIAGLHDLPGTGRPPIPDELVRRILACSLDDPPAGAERWTTRAVAAATGASQASVSRTRRRWFPPAAPVADALDDRTSILAYVGVHPAGCVLGFHAGTGTRAPATPARADALETVVCAALLRPPAGPHDGVTGLLRRATARLPPGPGAVLVTDVALDPAARAWLRRHPGVTVRSVPGEAWFALVHRLADTVDPGQFPELREVQRRVRRARRAGATGFEWARAELASASLTAGPAQPEPEPLPQDLDSVVRAICTAIADGELRAAEAIPVRRIARASGMSPGRVADALASLAAEALVEKRAGRYLLPTPTPRDVAETYTARGLLGTAIARRLATTGALPPVVDEHEAGLLRCHGLGLTAEACTIDLDLQDELARAAALPRIGAMFVRLTLQLRLFLAIFGLSYRYPTDEIVVDDQRILTEIRRRDPEAAVEAWRHKIDNCARYMLARLGPTA